MIYFFKCLFFLKKSTCIHIFNFHERERERGGRGGRICNSAIKIPIAIEKERSIFPGYISKIYPDYVDTRGYTQPWILPRV